MSIKSINLVVEGRLDQKIMEKICGPLGLGIGRVLGKKGRSFIEKNLRSFHQAAAQTGSNWLVLVDLDADECAPQYLHDHSPGSAHNFLLRVAVRELEAWLLADRERIANFLGVAESKIPFRVEEVFDPKQLIVDLARKSRKREIRDDLPPQPGVTAKQGILYNARMGEFINRYWRLEEARKSSDSLNRMYARLKSFRSR